MKYYRIPYFLAAAILTVGLAALIISADDYHATHVQRTGWTLNMEVHGHTFVLDHFRNSGDCWDALTTTHNREVYPGTRISFSCDNPVAN